MKGVLQLKIFVDGITPKIWRRFLVKDSLSFHGLHNIIQIVMGWDNYHLHSFCVNKEEIREPDSDFDREITDSKKTKLKDKLTKEKQKFGYLYDFGDNWEHSIIVEKILDEKDVQQCPVCLDGERACPPEDCGSVSGYYELQRMQKNKKHPEYKRRIVEWLGRDFDFELFDIDMVNKELERIARKRK